MGLTLLRFTSSDSAKTTKEDILLLAEFDVSIDKSSYSTVSLRS